MTTPAKHIERLKKHVRRMEDELHRIYRDGHVKRPNEFATTADLSEAIHKARQAFENERFMET
jgi:hypothetical protein